MAPILSMESSRICLVIRNIYTWLQKSLDMHEEIAFDKSEISDLAKRPIYEAIFYQFSQLDIKIAKIVSILESINEIVHIEDLTGEPDE